jgi:hypothetical protein
VFIHNSFTQVGFLKMYIVSRKVVFKEDTNGAEGETIAGKEGI